MQRRLPIVVAAVLALAGAPVAAELLPLGRNPKLDPDQVTVSGVSAGGAFAHQFHIAHADLVSGAAMIAAAPYACAAQIPGLLSFNPLASVFVALGTCSRKGRNFIDPFDLWLPALPSVDWAVAITAAADEAGDIDDPAGLADDRVWLFTGAADDIVPPAIVGVLHDYYRALGLGPPQLVLEENGSAHHGVPIAAFTGASEHPVRRCDEYGLPFLLECGFDAAERLLAHLYPTGFVAEPQAPDRGRIQAFDQTVFFAGEDASISMGSVGYLYVPAGCAADAPAATPCRLHVAFHGCQQHIALVGDDFYWDAGYNRWAEANRVVVLYPQVTAWNRPLDITGLSANPQACWDWWGYSGPDYFRRSGKQMQAVRQMIEQLLPE